MLLIAFLVSLHLTAASLQKEHRKNDASPERHASLALLALLTRPAHFSRIRPSPLQPLPARVAYARTPTRSARMEFGAFLEGEKQKRSKRWEQTQVEMKEQREVQQAHVTLGLTEDSDFDEFREQFEKLTEKHKDDPKKLLQISAAKGRIISDTVREWIVEGKEEEKKERREAYKMLWGRFKKKYFKKKEKTVGWFALPTIAGARNAILMHGGVCALGWIVPGKAMGLTPVHGLIACSNMYNKEKDLAAEPTDEFGNPGTVKPLKKRKALVGALISWGIGGLAFLAATRMMSETAPYFASFTNSAVGIALLFPSLFVKLDWADDFGEGLMFWKKKKDKKDGED